MNPPPDRLRHRLKGINLYLIGMMGSGKSTVGKLLAQELSYRFFDTDSVIEQASGQTVQQIFSGAGEAEFRQLETRVFAELSVYTRLVVATGGGLAAQLQNWSYLQQGIVIWLNAPVEVLYHRLKQDASRPLLQTADPQSTLQSLLQTRQQFYAQADLEIAIHPEDSAQQVTLRLLESIPSVLRSDTVELQDS